MLRYVGNGFLAGIPARDLTDAEVEQYGGADELLATGLYARAGKPTTEPSAIPARGVIDLRDGQTLQTIRKGGK